MHSFLEHIEERFGLYEGQHVPLEQPMIEIDEDQAAAILAKATCAMRAQK